MSGLEKFEGTEAWFARLRSLLLMQRLAPKKEDIDSSVSNFVVDLSEDLKQMFEEIRSKKMDKENQQPNAVQESSSKEKTEDLNQISAISQNSTRFSNFSRSTLTSHNDSTFYYDEPSVLRQTTDESFERVEKMCNKSMSDPDSTLFQYVKSFHESRQLEDEESEALDRLLDEFGMQDEMRKMSLTNQTQIANVEPPSCLFEDTLTGDVSTYRTSPVKMVGLLRPSTIMEESLLSDTTETSSFSYNSAHKTTETSSEQYYTANETHKGDHINANSKANTENDIQTNGVEKDTSDQPDKTLSYEDSYDFDYQEHPDNYQPSNKPTCEDGAGSTASQYSVNNTGKPLGLSQFEESTYPLEGHVDNSMTSSKSSSKIIFDVFPNKKHKFFGADLSRGLLSPDKLSSSHSVAHSSGISSNSSRHKNTLSDVSSLMEDSLNMIEYRRNKRNTTETEYRDSLDTSSDYRRKGDDLINLEDDSLRTPRRSAVVKAKTTIIEISDDEDGNKSLENTELNEGFSVNAGDGESSTFNISREFNDTIEEMEYIMKKGIKYMTEKGATPPVKGATLSASKVQHSPYMPDPRQDKKLPSAEKLKNHDVFKKPISCTRIPQSKTFFAVKKATNFSHVVSPVGAYIKNTPKTPLTANAKPIHDVYKSKAMRELGFGSKPQTPESERCNLKTNSSSLPKKAYISAEYKRVVDQRTPVVIPGGEKIHRYLQPAAAVICHEGKVKFNMLLGEKIEEPKANLTVDSSLADLSVMSGDVSLLTIKDAKKIGD